MQGWGILCPPPWYHDVHFCTIRFILPLNPERHSATDQSAMVAWKRSPGRGRIVEAIPDQSARGREIEWLHLSFSDDVAKAIASHWLHR